MQKPKTPKEKEWHFIKMQTCENKIKKYKELLKAETNLYYVAITRAKEILIDGTPNHKEWEDAMKAQSNQTSKIQKINFDSHESVESKSDSQITMPKICFSVEDRKILTDKLKVFFDSSNNIKEMTWLNHHCAFIQTIESLLLDNYYVEGQFNPTKWGSYIVFMRRDMRRHFNVKTSWGVYCRVHFSPTAPQNEKIEISLNFSYNNKYDCDALQKMHSYNKSNANNSFFTYPNYDMDLVIDKLQQDLNYFLEIPLVTLQPLR